MQSGLQDFTDEDPGADESDVVWTIEHDERETPVSAFDDEAEAREAYEKYRERGATAYGLVRQSADDVEVPRA